MTIRKGIALIALIAFWHTNALAETFADFYTNQVPFTRIVTETDLSIDSLCGVYTYFNPDVGGLSGRNLYLFLGRTFVLTRWADIMDETPLLSGTWERKASTLSLGYPPQNSIEWFDSTYTTVIYDDGRKQRPLLIGSNAGQQRFKSFLKEYGHAVQKARTEYFSITERSSNFVFRTWAEEFTYVMTFSAGYAKKRPISEGDADRFKAYSRTATPSQTEESVIEGFPRQTLENQMRDTILPAAPFLGREINVLDVFPWLEEMTRLTDPNGMGIKFDVRITDSRPLEERNTMEPWRGRQEDSATWPQIHRATVAEYLIYLTTATNLTYTVTANKVIVEKTE